MVCRNICQTIHTKIEVGQEMYFAGKKYCRRCEIFLYHNGMFCPCCGMQLRLSPARKRDKERIRRKSRQKRSKIMMAGNTSWSTQSFLDSNEYFDYTMLKTTLAKCQCGHYRIFHLATGHCDHCNCQKYHELAVFH